MQLQLPYLVNVQTVIKPDDILAITITSLNKETNDIINFNNINPLLTTTFPGQSGSMRGQPLGFLVDKEGGVEMPMIGKVNLLGMRTDQAAEMVRKEVEKILKNPSVNIRFLNHKFSVLGEVARPGVFNLLDDRTTLPEALAMAGDLTAFGNRKNVMLIRDYEGDREIVRINLSNKDIFHSKYYYLRNGDLLYVEPLPSKGTYAEQKVQLAPIYMSAISTLAIVVTLILNVVK